MASKLGLFCFGTLAGAVEGVDNLPSSACISKAKRRVYLLPSPLVSGKKLR